MSRLFSGVSQRAKLLVVVRLEHSKPSMKGPLAYHRLPIEPRNYLLLTIPVVCIGLGTWQIYRRKWKLQLIEELKDKTHRQPVLLPEDLDELKGMEYQKVLLRGSFDYSREAFIGPRTLLTDGGGLLSSGSTTGGVHVVTPFKLIDRNLTVLVNRGWAPQKYAYANASRSDGSSQSPQQQNGDVVTITGIVRLPEMRQPLTPKESTSRGLWLRRDIQGIADQLGTTPVFVDADEQLSAASSEHFPVSGQTRVTMRNEHLSYIFTWYSLAAATTWIFYTRFLRRPPDSLVTRHRTREKR